MEKLLILVGLETADYELKDLGSQEPFEGSDPYDSYEEALENALLTSLAYIKDLNNDI